MRLDYHLLLLHRTGVKASGKRREASSNAFVVPIPGLLATLGMATERTNNAAGISFCPFSPLCPGGLNT